MDVLIVFVFLCWADPLSKGSYQLSKLFVISESNSELEQVIHIAGRGGGEIIRVDGLRIMPNGGLWH
jgi:hypothetical protein